MINNLTRVEVINRAGEVSHSIRFGRHVYRQDINSQKAFCYYKPHHLVGYIRWYVGEYGSKYWRILIFMTLIPQAKKQMQQIPGVKPGVMLILDLGGATMVRKLLSALNHAERFGFNLTDISPAYYGHLHQRILANSPYHFYTEEQHQSYLKETGMVQ